MARLLFKRASITIVISGRDGGGGGWGTMLAPFECLRTDLIETWGGALGKGGGGGGVLNVLKKNSALIMT